MNLPPSYPTYEERTFNLYQIKENPGVEYLRHPSGVIVIRLSADHECLSKEIQEVSFETSSRKGKDLTKQVVVGKGKKGGLKLMPETKLCLIKCKDETCYKIRSGIKATLIEANSKLIEDPQLLKNSRVYAGFLAVVIPPAVLNNHKNNIPPEFDTIIRVGREISFATKIFAQKHQDKAEKLMDVDEPGDNSIARDENECNGQDELDPIEPKRQKLED